jgi:3-phytase
MRPRLLMACLFLLACDDGEPPPVTPVTPTVDVPASGETESPNDGDPDDPAIWRDPDDAARSILVTTDKTFGLRLFDLDGRLLHEYADGEMNNVDLRDDLVAASDRRDNSIAVYRVDAAARGLVPLGRVAVGSTVYGFCLARLGAETFAYVTSKEGEVVQFRLRITDETVSGSEVRRVAVGGQLEGCVVDDEAGALYVGEEDVGVWRLGAAPEAGATRVAVDRVGLGHLVADVEGMAIFRGEAGAGYLVVSSQGDSSYVLYDRAAPNAYVGRFHVRGGALDPATETDGLDVVSGAMGEKYPGGLMVVQDDQNAGFTRCFKLIGWQDVADALQL